MSDDDAERGGVWYEYSVEHVSRYNVERELNAYGAKGWQVVQRLEDRRETESEYDLYLLMRRRGVA